MNIEKTNGDIRQNKNISEHLEKQLERTNYWLSFAEAKNAGLIVVNVAVITIVAQLFEKDTEICTIFIIGLILSCVVCLISSLPNMTNSIPNVSKKPSSKEALNLCYYGDISKISAAKEYLGLSIQRYFTNINDGISNNIAFDLAQEICINSRIAARKCKLFIWAVIVDILAIIAVGIFVLLKEFGCYFYESCVA